MGPMRHCGCFEAAGMITDARHHCSSLWNSQDSRSRSSSSLKPAEAKVRKTKSRTSEKKRRLVTTSVSNVTAWIGATPGNLKKFAREVRGGRGDYSANVCGK